MIIYGRKGDSMNGVYLLIGTFFIIAIILVTVVLVALKKHQYKKFKEKVEKLDKEKNLIASTPVYSELSKVESIVKNDLMEEKYKNWQKRFEVIKEEKINNISDMINELDLAANMKDYKNFDSKVAKVEMEVYKVRENADRLLDEIKEITVSDEKYRGIVTKLKSKYRKLVYEFNNHKDDYEDIIETIELQFETIEKRFQEFENAMENNEYEEVNHIVKALDTMIDHMSTVIVEVPDLVLLSKKLIPKRIEEILSSNKKMEKAGYNIKYLNIEYNMEETNKNVSNIIDRIRVLNLDDCMFELKTILDYLDNILDDMEKEKLARMVYSEHIVEFADKLKKAQKVVKDINKQLDDIHDNYILEDSSITNIENAKLNLESIKKSYQEIVKKEGKSVEPYSTLTRNLDNLLNILIELEDGLDTRLSTLLGVYDDEVRARSQLDEIRDLIKQCKVSIRNYKLPIIMNNYFVELSEANDAIDEIAKELDKKPIVIETLNTRVDTARDLVLKLYRTTTDMVKTAQLAEMAIVYGNRYRSSRVDLNRKLENAEMLYHKGNYKEALDVSLSAIELVDKDIKDKLLKVYGG